MENQHQKITGYRDLTQADIDLMNEIKSHGIATEALVKKVQERISTQFHATMPAYAEPKNTDEEAFGTECIDTPEQTEAKVIEAERLSKCQAPRWLAIANTDLQQGLMALTRAVAQPSTY